MLVHPDKFARVGALEAVDRLLGVADRKDRADRVASALAGEEFPVKRGAGIAAALLGRGSVGDQPLADRPRLGQEGLEIVVELLAPGFRPLAPASKNMAASPVGRRSAGERRGSGA